MPDEYINIKLGDRVTVQCLPALVWFDPPVHMSIVFKSGAGPRRSIQAWGEVFSGPITGTVKEFKNRGSEVVAIVLEEDDWAFDIHVDQIHQITPVT